MDSFLFPFLPVAFKGPVLAQYGQFLGEWSYGIDALAESGVVIVGNIYIEHILPLAPDDGE